MLRVELNFPQIQVSHQHLVIAGQLCKYWKRHLPQFSWYLNQLFVTCYVVGSIHLLTVYSISNSLSLHSYYARIHTHTHRIFAASQPLSSSFLNKHNNMRSCIIRFLTNPSFLGPLFQTLSKCVIDVCVCVYVSKTKKMWDLIFYFFNQNTLLIYITWQIYVCPSCHISISLQFEKQFIISIHQFKTQLIYILTPRHLKQVICRVLFFTSWGDVKKWLILVQFHDGITHAYMVS